MKPVCVEVTKQKILVLSENKSVIKIQNPNQREIQKHEVDGCLITSGIRCDWLIIDSETEKETYIELKGCQIGHAVDQIKESVQALTKDRNAKKLGYVICTRSPMNTAEIQVLTKTLYKNHNLSLRVRKSNYTVSLDELIQ